MTNERPKYFIPAISTYANEFNEPTFKSVDEARQNGNGGFTSQILLLYPLLWFDVDYNGKTIHDYRYDYFNKFYIVRYRDGR